MHERVRFLLAVCAGTMIPHYLQSYMGEVFTACAVGLGTALMS